MNRLQCPLCRSQYQKPHMCPHCSKVFCYQCIRVYLNQYYFCPACDKHVIDLIDCSRLIDQVKQTFLIRKQNNPILQNNLQITPIPTFYQTSAPLTPFHKSITALHVKQTSVQIAVSSHKKYFYLIHFLQHKSHEIKPIQQIRPQKNVLTHTQLKQIYNKILFKIQTNRDEQKQYILEMELLKSQIKYNKAKIYQYYEELILRLEKESVGLLEEIEGKINQCNRQIKQKQKIKEKLKQFNLNPTITSSSNPKTIPSIKKINSCSQIQHTTSKSLLSQQINKKISQKQLNQNEKQQFITINDRQLFKYLEANNYLEIKQKEKQSLASSVNNGNSKLKQKINSLLMKQHQHQHQCNKNKIQQKQKPYYKKSTKKIQQKSSLLRQQKKTFLEQQNQFMANNHTNSSFILDKKIYQLSIMKQIYPQYQNFSYEFDYNVQRHQNIIYSQNFKVYGYEWRLKIYPSGNSQTLSKYLSVFLELVNSPQALTTNAAKEYYFRLELLNLNQAGKSIIKQYKSHFSVGQCWGYAEFIQISEISNYLQDNKLLFIMGIKNISYFDLCQNMKKYVTKLQGENKILSQLCENYYLGTDHVENARNNVNLHEQQIISSNSQTSYENIQVESSLLSGINNFYNRNHNQNHQSQSSVISSFHQEDSYI